jgi:L-serine dehydratase
MSISTFDCLGPIMIGPSSSHTAGAAKIGLVANKISDNDIKSVIFYLHGSFAKTYKGHGTDKALLGGLLGFDEKDKRIKFSFELAKERKIEYKFIAKDLGDVHPNTVLIEIISSDNKKISIQGTSTGGGAMEINSLNGLKVKFSGTKPTIITTHKDVPGVVSKVTAILAEKNLNISTMSVSKNETSNTASMIIELDEKFDYSIKKILLDNISSIEKIYLF